MKYKFYKMKTKNRECDNYSKIPQGEEKMKKNYFTIVGLIILCIFTLMSCNKQHKLNNIKIDEDQLAKVISEQEDLIAARNQYWSENQEKMDLSAENQIKYPEETGQGDSNSLKGKIYCIENNIIEPHVLDNGETGIYLNEKERTWNLSKEDKISISIEAYIEKFGSKGYLLWGYYKDGIENRVEDFYIEKEKQLEFTAPEDGDYEFFLTCASSDPIVIKYILFD